ncbi:MAG: tetratricopeptide repeat protein [Bacteroidota bacterium]|nr:tetratricopeptide repeat protein [Bacteroidota bacterium]
MKFILSTLIVFTIFISSCQSPEEKAAEKAKQDSIANVNARVKAKFVVDSAEQVMRADKTYNMKNAMGTLKAYNDYVTKFPTDTITAEYLFRAADLAQGAKQYTQAVNYLETIIENHKGYRNSDIACFMAAYIYDNNLEEVNHGGDRAKQLYQFVIDNYPESTWAEQAKVLITYVGVSENVMLDSIIKKGQREEQTNGVQGKQSNQKSSADQPQQNKEVKKPK